ncbi:MAG TPA: hypothetical protein PK530_09825, partial [Anaerolineales bacterium]|nr:hypothetical protein [Anaerolineales bacterium]
MKRTWLVFWRTYWGGIRQGSFLLFTFGLPAFFILIPIVGSAILLWVIRSALPPTDYRPVGVVDESGFFSAPAGGDPVEMIGYGTEAEAIAAFGNGEIQGYYFIPKNYLASGTITLTYETAPSLEVDLMFSGWVEAQIETQVPETIRVRYVEGASFAHEEAEGETSFSGLDFLKW